MGSRVLVQGASSGEQFATLGALEFNGLSGRFGVIQGLVSFEFTGGDKVFGADGTDLVRTFGLDQLLPAPSGGKGGYDVVNLHLFAACPIYHFRSRA